MSNDQAFGGERRRTLLALLAITALSVLVRLIGLGTRIFHWDEGRVGYWVLRYAETGLWQYRPIVHGPFLFQVDKYVFSLLGVSDFSARLVVALLGGALPLAAWLFREHLRDAEVVALGLFFGANPLLVYYSRFMRNDVLVAAFMVFALGFFVRAIDTGSARYLYPGTLCFALAFTTKENAFLYPVCWIGALVLLLDHRLLLAARPSLPRVVRAGRGPDESGETPSDPLAGDGGIDFILTSVSRREIVLGYLESVARGLRRWAGPLVVCAILFFVVIVVFYAPRTAGNGLGFDTALFDPTLWPALAETTLTSTGTAVYDLWIAGGHQDHSYLPYLGHYLQAMLYGAATLSLFALVGFLADRYSDRGPRDFVSLSFYWGVASVFGYPIVTDIQAPWSAVHAVVPLAVPAAVGAALLYRWGRDALRNGDAVGISLALVILVVATGTTAAATADLAYVHPADQSNEEVVQWAQPADDLKPVLEEVGTVSARNPGTDVLFWGSTHPTSDEELFYVENESSDLQPPPASGWYDRLPLPWYLERYGAVTTSTPPDADPKVALSNPPPVVIAYAWDRTEIAPYLPGYTAYERKFKLWDENIVVFIDESKRRQRNASAIDSSYSMSADRSVNRAR